MNRDTLPNTGMPNCQAIKLFKGQKALVTGEGSGIGKAVAIELARAGANENLNFATDEEGQPDTEPTISQSDGLVPFGFVFDRRGHLLVAEPGSGTVSSYAIRQDYTLEIIDASVADGNRATCWIAGIWFGAVFTDNTGSDNVSSYTVKASNGSLDLREAVAASGNKPIDMAVTDNGKYLYILNAEEGTVGAFRISPKGGLEDLGTVEGLSLGYAQGIVAR